VRNLESHLHVVDQCAPREIANGAENLILQALQFQKIGFRRYFLFSYCHRVGPLSCSDSDLSPQLRIMRTFDRTSERKYRPILRSLFLERTVLEGQTSSRIWTCDLNVMETQCRTGLRREVTVRYRKSDASVAETCGTHHTWQSWWIVSLCPLRQRNLFLYRFRNLLISEVKVFLWRTAGLLNESQLSAGELMRRPSTRDFGILMFSQ
jgi:hypothetical protein